MSRTPRPLGDRIGLRTALLMFVVVLAMIGTLFPSVVETAAADLSACGSSEVGGTIMRDQNTNGASDAGEVPYRPVFIDTDGDGINDNAIVVNAYDASGALVATTTSDADGDFTLLGITERVRVEFIVPAHIESAHAGAISASAVQFADPGTCDLAYSVFESSEYCDADPFLAVPCYVFDDHATGAYANTDVLVSFRASDFTVGTDSINNTSVADWQDAAPNKLAVSNEMGTTWGVAYNETADVLYSAAFLKAGSDYGPGGPGAIYATPIDPATGAAAATATVFYTGDTCDDLHGVDFNLPGEFNVDIHNNAHKCDWGDLQMSPDDSILYGMDLLSRSVIGIDTASGAVVSTWPVPLDQDTVLDIDGNGSCTNPVEDIRPFALGWKDGLLFAGMICSGESTATQDDIESYVYAISPATGAFTLVASWDTNDYDITHWNSSYWDPNNTTGVSQLTLSDIVFYGDDMTVAYRDRGTDMATDINDYGWETSPGSELLCLGWDAASNSYVMESANQCGSRPGNAAGASIYDTGEFYWGDGRNSLNDPLGVGNAGSHSEIVNGGLAQVNTALLYAPGTNATDALVPRSVYTGSVISIDNETGGPVEGYGLFSGRIDASGEATGTVGKASGLGDIEALCEAAPMEIGNYVWFDVDGDGVQDPDEAPVVGATVNLYDSAGMLVATTTTGPDGDYYFDVDPNTDYVIRMDNPADFAAGGVLEGWAATQADATPLSDANDDARDSDGMVAADGYPEIVYTSGSAGQNDHTLDFGYTAPFDLALTKQLADGTNLGSFAPGDTVTFTITVANQGQVDATDVAVVDYLPAGLTLADAAWTDNGDGTATLNTNIASLPVGTDVDVDITFTVDADAAGQIDNWAEIASASDGAGDPATDIDSTPNTDPADDNQPTGPNDTTDDETGENGLTGGDEDDHDVAGITVTPPVGTFDLALTKQLADGTNLGSFTPGAGVMFTITVENQGTIEATNVAVVDYLPTGLTLADANWTDNADGTATLNTPIPALAAGASTTVNITFTVDADASGQIDNWAEIAGASDGAGDPVTDVDSTPNTDPADDNQPNGPNDTTDDETGENGLAGGDEDDHDVAGITVTPVDVFDLALIKQLPLGVNMGTVDPGDTVTFAIIVENQGTIDATNVAVVDYVPAGLTLNDPAWIDNGDGTATLNTTIASLVVGASATVNITFTVDADATGQLDNWAEIASAADGNGDPATDIDSTPNTDPDDDNQPTGPNDTTDDETGQNGLAGGDEDDHDVAGVTVGEPQTYSLGNQVWLDDNNNGVIDPGEAPIEGVWVELFTDNNGDGLPDDINGDGIIDGNDAVATTGTDADGNYLFDRIDPGEYVVGIPPMEWDTDGPLHGTLSSGPTSTDPNDDVDNDDNGTPGPHGYVWSGPVTIGDGEPTGEVNDNDPNTPDANENLTVDFGFHRPTFDLALFKQLSDGTNLATVTPGQTVTFTMEIINQGDVDAANLTIVDYLPASLTLSDTDWTNNGDGTASIDVAGPIKAGESLKVDITFVVEADATGTIDNWGEIAHADPVDVLGKVVTMPNGDPIPDADSIADDSNDDTFTTDDDVDGNSITGGDEDDHDQAQVTVSQPTPTPTPTPVPTQPKQPELAFSGSNSLLLAGLAMTLILLGGAAMIVSRTRLARNQAER